MRRLMVLAVGLVMGACGGDLGARVTEADAAVDGAVADAAGPACELPALPGDVCPDIPTSVMPPGLLGEWEIHFAGGTCPTERPTLLACVRGNFVQLAEDPTCGVAWAGLGGSFDVPLCDGTSLRVCGLRMGLSPTTGRLEGGAMAIADCDGCVAVNQTIAPGSGPTLNTDCIGWP